MTQKKFEVGLIQVYTGEGKGKTTAALGLALRAVGHGFRVYMIQFMKGDIEYGEVKAQKFLTNLTIVQFGRPSFVDRQNPAAEDIELAQAGLSHAKEVVKGGEYDIVILDELAVAVDYKLMDIEDVIDLMDAKPKDMEIIITGRNAHPRILERADLISKIENIKHPYDRGIPARNGIEH